MPQLNLHYTTIGTPVKNAAGMVTNAVLIMHGTGGSGRGFLSQTFGGQLFGAGQLLDATRYFIILPDDIGHGKSSKPSDGLHMKFPHYTYTDMVHAEYRLVTEKLGVNHLRLVMGTSMGAMHTWMWGDHVPRLHGRPDAPGLGAGGDRRAQSHAPQDDHGFHQARSELERRRVQRSAEQHGGGELRALHDDVEPAATAQAGAHARAGRRRCSNAASTRRGPTDANDMLYHYDCSRDYNPQPDLEKIKAPLYAVNSADDQVNPPELGILEREIKRVKRGRYILIPTSDETRGHGTHSLPAIWGKYLAELLKESEPRP